MRKRQLIELSVLTALILGLLAYIIFRDTDKIRYDLPVLEEIESSEIDKIEIAKGSGDTVTLEKFGDSWNIVEIDRKADNFQVGQLLDLLAKASPVDLVAERSDGEPYGLSEEDAVTVSLIRDDIFLRTLSVGRATPSRGFNFIRLPGEKAVYTCRGNLESLIPETPDDIRNMSVLTFNTMDVNAVQIIRGDDTNLYKLNIDDDQSRNWTTSDGNPFDNQLMESFLFKAADLTAADYVDNVIPSDRVIRIDFIPVGSWIEIHGEGERQYSCRSSDSEDPFMISAYMAESFIGNFFPPDEE